MRLKLRTWAYSDRALNLSRVFTVYFKQCAACSPSPKTVVYAAWVRLRVCTHKPPGIEREWVRVNALIMGHVEEIGYDQGTFGDEIPIVDIILHHSMRESCMRVQVSSSLPGVPGRGV
jgi:hypothetical protein